MFFVIDGGDGAGKSTQVALLAQWLTAAGRRVITCRDPGTTALGESVRQVLLHRIDMAIHRRSEMLLYMAARAQLVEEVVRPALETAAIVISDRYLLSNVVYQGHAGGLDPEVVRRLGLLAAGELVPELTIVLDLPAELAAARLARPLDRMEQQGLEFHRRVSGGYRAEAARDTERIVLVDAARPVDAVQDDIRQLVLARLSGASQGRS